MYINFQFHEDHGDAWRSLVTFDDMWVFFMTEPHVLSWHEFSWHITNYFREVPTHKMRHHRILPLQKKMFFLICHHTERYNCTSSIDSMRQDRRVSVCRHWFWHSGPNMSSRYESYTCNLVVSMDLWHIYPGIRDSDKWLSLFSGNGLHAPSHSRLTSTLISFAPRLKFTPRVHFWAFPH